MKQAGDRQVMFVRKGNDLINARHELTVNENRLILLTLTQISPNDEDFKPYRIKISDFIDYTSTNNKAMYDRARQITKSLMGKVLEIPQENGHLQVAFISRARYERGKGYVELSFDPVLKPYLLQLKERYTQYDVRNILPLQSFYSQRIYELLKQYGRIGERRMAVDDMREMLRLSSAYNHYGSFKKRVILQAQRELRENTDLSFEFAEIKTGRKVTHIHFKIDDRSVRTQRDASVGKKEPANTAMVEVLTNEFGLNKVRAGSIVKCHSGNYIAENLEIVRRRFRLGQVKNLAPYTLKALETDFRSTAGTLEQERVAALQESQKALRDKEDARATEEALLHTFEEARSKALDLASDELTDAQLLAGFEEFVKKNHRFAYDHVRKHEGKLLDHLNHAMIRPIYHQFLALMLLPARFHSFEAWRGE